MTRHAEISAMSVASDRNIILFERCLVVQLQQVHRACDRKSSSGSYRSESDSPTPTEENSYLLAANGLKLFQVFQEVNSKCFWNAGLLQAVSFIQYRGHVAPSTLIVTADEASLEVIRGAWSRKVLKAPNNFRIVIVGELDGCNVQPILQSQFTPLPEALCHVIWDLTQSGRPATIDSIGATLVVAFPEMTAPTSAVIYGTLGALIKDRKIYHTGSGYGIVTPETYRRTAYLEDDFPRPILMSDEEALVLAHGATEVYPAGYVTHRAVQTNLVDVICRGSPTDRVMFPRPLSERLGTTTPLPVKLERQRSLRVLAARKVSTLEQKLGGSLRLSPSKAKKLMESSLANSHCLSTDITVKSSTEFGQELSPRDKTSLLSRIFKKASLGRRKTVISSFSAQFPPPEWTEPGPVLHLHCVAVQTCPPGTAPEDDGAVSFVQVRKSRTESRRSRSQSRPHIKDIFSQEEVRRPSSLHRPAEVEIHSDERSVISRRSAIPFNMRHSLDESASPSRASSLGRRSALRHLRELDDRLDEEIRLSPKQPVSPTRSIDSQYSSMPDQNSRFSSPNRSSPTPSDCRSNNSDRRSPLRDVSSPRHRRSTVDSRGKTLPSVCERAETPKKTTVTRSDSYKNANRPDCLVAKKSPALTSVLPQKVADRRVSTPLVAVSPHRFLSPDRSVSPVKQIIAENRERFFRSEENTPVVSPKSIEDRIDEMKLNQRMSVMEDLKSPNLVRSSNFQTMTVLDHSRSPSIDYKVQLPKYGTLSPTSTEKGGSRVINISVTRSESMKFAKDKSKDLKSDTVGDLITCDKKMEGLFCPEIENYPRMEKGAGFEKIVKSAKFENSVRRSNFENSSNIEDCAKIEVPGLVPDCESGGGFRTFPSLTELNIQFTSITGQRILQGISMNSIDTLVEVNMRADGKEDATILEHLGVV